MDPRWLRSGFIYLLILVAVVTIFFVVYPGGEGEQDIPVTRVIQMAQGGQIERLEVRGDEIGVVNFAGDKFVSRKETSASILQVLHDAGVTDPDFDIVVKSQGQFGSIFGILINFLPLIFFGGLLLFMMRQAQGGNSQALGFGKSKARLFTENRPTVTFADVAGVEEAKEELAEIVDFLKYPERFTALGARTPRGVLLIGPPGTGKTLLSRAVAGEAGVPFFSISGSEFVEMFVGVGASRVRDLFERAKRNSPCIVFVDEIDAVGRHRGAGVGGSHDEREQTLNQILVEMDGFDTNTNVIVIAATNRPDILDPALLRPGRFDRQVVLDHPDVQGRKAILGVHTKGKPIDPTVNVDTLAKVTPGFTGADLANLVNEGAILAARRGRKTVSMDELEEAIDRVIAGPQRKSRVISAREKETTAYHEAGHAVVAWKLPHADPVQKVSVVARGAMGGYTRLLPVEDRHLWSKSQFEAMLGYAMGGRVAEEVKFGEITTGAENDIQQATRTARKMITEYGMSAKLGPRTLGRKEELVFLGREISEQRDYSDKVAEQIDDEVHSLIGTAYEQARVILIENRAKLDQVAQALMEHETLEGEALTTLFNAPAPAHDPDAQAALAAPTVPALAGGVADGAELAPKRSRQRRVARKPQTGGAPAAP